MALVICPDCRTQISSDAPVCPRCGRKKPRTIGESLVTIAIGVVLCLVALYGAMMWLATRTTAR